MKPEDETQTTQYGINSDNLKVPPLVDDLTGLPIQQEPWDEIPVHAYNCENPQGIPSGLWQTEEPSASIENENLLRLHYQVNTEEQASLPGHIDSVNTPEENSNATGNTVKTSRKKRRQIYQSSLLGIFNDPEAPHGLVMDGRKSLPKHREGPVKCHCGKQYNYYYVLLQHVRDTLRSPEELFRCEVCYQQQPSMLTLFNRKLDLTRHIKGIHEGKRRTRCPCEHCGKNFHPLYIRRHMELCQTKEQLKQGQEKKDAPAITPGQWKPWRTF